MEKITGSDGTVRYDTETDASPEEHQRNLEKEQIKDGYCARFALEGKNPTTPEAQKEIEIMAEEEMRRREKKEAAASNVIPFPKKDDSEEKMRKAA